MSSGFERYGIECREGWKALYEPLIEMCKKEGVEIFQIKEKFGGLRFYIRGAGSRELQMAISTAESDSFTICEVCGEEGKVRDSGWRQTLCDTHAEEYAKKSVNGP